MIPLLAALLLVGSTAWLKIRQRTMMAHLVEARVDRFSLICEKMFLTRQSQRCIDDHLIGLDRWGQKFFLIQLNQWLHEHGRYASTMTIGAPTRRRTYIILHQAEWSRRIPRVS